MPKVAFEQPPLRRLPTLPRLFNPGSGRTHDLGQVGNALAGLAAALDETRSGFEERRKSAALDELANALMNRGEAAGADPFVVRATRPDGSALPDPGPVPFATATEPHAGGIDEMNILAGLQAQRDGNAERMAKAAGRGPGGGPGGRGGAGRPREFAPDRDEPDDAVKYSKEFEATFGVPLADWTGKSAGITKDEQGNATLVMPGPEGKGTRTIQIPKPWVDRFEALRSGSNWVRSRNGGQWRPPGPAAANPYAQPSAAGPENEPGLDPLPSPDPVMPLFPGRPGRRATLPTGPGQRPNGNAPDPTAPVAPGEPPPMLARPQATTPVAKLPADIQAEIATVRGLLAAKKITEAQARERLARIGGQ